MAAFETTKAESPIKSRVHASHAGTPAPLAAHENLACLALSEREEASRFHHSKRGRCMKSLTGTQTGSQFPLGVVVRARYFSLLGNTLSGFL